MNNKETTGEHSNSGEIAGSKRRITAIPKSRKLNNILQDRLHMILWRFGFLKEKFTMLINALPRVETKTINRYDNVDLIYAGVGRQRKFLEGMKDDRVNFLDKHWSFLDHSHISSEKAVVGSGLYESFKKGIYELEDIPKKGMGKLDAYFRPILKPAETKKTPTPRQEAEFAILNHHFEIRKYRYVAVPLIQFAEFDGIVYIIYHDDDHESLTPFALGNIIKAFSTEYEAIIWSWDIVDKNIYKKTFVVDLVKNATDSVLYEQFNKNPILNELKYKEYYERHLIYFLQRREQNDAVAAVLFDKMRQTAIMSILIDSYAHNISAHSLTALEWWFKKRADRLASGDLDIDRSVSNIQVIESKKQLAGEIHPLLKFLLEKGAFWTGLTRKESFGGKISNLYEVLWYDFINNPLYLGSIAFSEGILKLNINITILESEKVDEGIKYHKKVKKIGDRVYDGRFVQINLTQIYEPSAELDYDKISDFVFPDRDNYNAFKEILQTFKAFFPGGVVGKHAFFTTLENEIRNVKHYNPERRKQMQEEGLTLNISIEEDSYQTIDVPSDYTTEYYKIGIWLNHPVDLTQSLITKKLNKIKGDILTKETYQPKLGGSYQDKVCAAMLFNNTFISVQDRDNDRDKRYYPWLKSGACKSEDLSKSGYLVDYELSLRRWKNKEHVLSKELFESTFSEDVVYRGYLKKFLHIWKGENVYRLEKTDDLDNTWENYSRFRFISIPAYYKEGWDYMKKLGIYRTIEEETTDLATAYLCWLKQWRKKEGSYNIQFKVEGDVAAMLSYEKKGITFYNKNADELKNKTFEPDLKIPLAHSSVNSQGNEVCRYRNNQTLIQYFLEGKKKISEGIMPDALAAELFETFDTNICIFDNRIANRVEKANHKLLQDNLNCSIHEELISKWEEVKNPKKDSGLGRYHFLVIHLSFIEAFKDDKGEKKYSEDDINKFIEEEILINKHIDLTKGNFIIVITTGRGRTQWWDKLKEEYKTFVTFRPVESLIGTIERAITIEDDFEIKYGLVKVLFGS